MKSEDIPEGAINGKFSVSADKQVYFSKGNLQLSAANTWKFADSQWSYFGNSQFNNHRDLFGWGTGNNPNQTSTNNIYYRSFTDWGSNIISNGGNEAGLWRTLSKDEWVYLFNRRIVNGGTGNGHSYTLGQKVNGVSGVVLYSDNYTGAEYSGSDWSTFEAKGCVFLPIAGWRNNNTVSNVGSHGYYWSSTENTNVQDYAYDVTLSSSSISPSSTSSRFYGHSVRLVYDIT